MAKAILIIGKICVGKTTYARQLAARGPAVILSVDDFMLPLFGQHCERIEEKLSAAQDCLLQQAAAITGAGLDVILDWGFWSRADRAKTAAFFRERGIPVQWHYLAIPEESWRERIAMRNREVQAGLVAYNVSPGLARKCEMLFEEPEEIHELKRI